MPGRTVLDASFHRNSGPARNLRPRNRTSRIDVKRASRLTSRSKPSIVPCLQGDFSGSDRLLSAQTSVKINSAKCDDQLSQRMVIRSEQRTTKQFPLFG